jgi:hypothetical protein
VPDSWKRVAAADGTLEVPDEWKEFLLKRPVEGRVKAVTKVESDTEIPTYQLTLSSSKAQELKPGMIVWLYRPPLSRRSPYGDSATVVKIEDQHYIATTHTSGVAKGWGYSTLHQSNRGKLTEPWHSEAESADNDRSPPKRRTK